MSEKETELKNQKSSEKLTKEEIELQDTQLALLLQATQDLADSLSTEFVEQQLEAQQKRGEGLLWEHVDIHQLFLHFNTQYFNTLDSVSVQWSSRMTQCAGVCEEEKGGFCVIKLSEPLLKFRPQSDLIETLLHEMIHAHLFITRNNKDRSDHGPEFQKKMKKINQVAGTNITIYHDFHDEVDFYRHHWWKCDGPCQDKPPYFGFVKRTMNRAPGPSDPWFLGHQQKCGGAFTKFREPPEVKEISKKRKKDVVPPKNNKKKYRCQLFCQKKEMKENR